jgi:hypothetical protein
MYTVFEYPAFAAARPARASARSLPGAPRCPLTQTMLTVLPWLFRWHTILCHALPWACARASLSSQVRWKKMRPHTNREVAVNKCRRMAIQGAAYHVRWETETNTYIVIFGVPIADARVRNIPGLGSSRGQIGNFRVPRRQTCPSTLPIPHKALKPARAIFCSNCGLLQRKFSFDVVADG